LYPLGVISGTARAVHFFFPQIEQRIRRTTSSSRASHPVTAASVFGYAWRV
jgi:hypothetical protein